MYRPAQSCSVPIQASHAACHALLRHCARAGSPSVLHCRRPGSTESGISLQRLPLVLAAWHTLPLTPALAVIKYNSEQGGDALRNIFGGLYVAFVIVFAAKVLQRRTKRSLQKVQL